MNIQDTEKKSVLYVYLCILCVYCFINAQMNKLFIVLNVLEPEQMDYGCIVYFINKPNIHRISNDNQARCLVLPNDENIVVEKRRELKSYYNHIPFHIYKYKNSGVYINVAVSLFDVMINVKVFSIFFFKFK